MGISGDCCKPEIQPTWVVRIPTTTFEEKFVVAQPRPSIHQAPAVTREKLQNKATCTRPRRSALLTTTDRPLAPITSSSLIPLTTAESPTNETTSNEPDSSSRKAPGEVKQDTGDQVTRKRSLYLEEDVRPRKIPKYDVFTLWTAGMESIDTTTGRCQRRIQSSVLAEELLDDLVAGSRDPITVSAQALQFQKSVPIILEKLPSKIVSRDPDAPIEFLAQVLRTLKNYWILVNATKQLETMLPRSGDTAITASKILSRLSSIEIVLLASSTLLNEEHFSTLWKWRSSRARLEAKEMEAIGLAFCQKVSDLAPGSWKASDIFERWDKLCRELTRDTQVGIAEGESLNECYLEILKEISRQHKRRMHEDKKEMAIKERFGSVTHWDLKSIAVKVEMLHESRG